MKSVPEEHLPLCETCGYILEGLPEGAHCPECGEPVIHSTDPASRWQPVWEVAPGVRTFLLTSAQVLFRPSHFFLHFTTRVQTRSSGWFAVIWRAICSALLALAIYGHLRWLETRNWGPAGLVTIPLWAFYIYGAIRVFSVVWIYLMFALLHRAASSLSAWEARYRGLRLPRAVVERGLRYHTVHLLPVCLLGAVTVGAYHLILSRRGGDDNLYLYTLCGEVIVSAGYLFFTYWAAMRNMLYANK